MKIIKDKKLITLEYCEKLSKWIISHQNKFFSKENEAVSWEEIELWQDKKTDRKHLIMPNEVCIIDRMWNGRHAYLICKFYAKGKKVKDLFLVVYVDQLNRNKWKNGYFLIPDLREGEI